jgi:hypothetical protein
MPDRDAFWCAYLHVNYQEKGVVEGLLRSADAVEHEHVGLDTAERWATILLWFCAAADRRVRDNATKAVVRITERHRDMWPRLISRFAQIDDEYVVERCFCAAYGALLRTRDRAAERTVAATAYREVLENPPRFQNALVRDYVRCILELAAEDDALPEGISMANCMPPYQSEWPLHIPSVDDIEKSGESSAHLPKLHYSCFHDDFNVYSLNRLSGYENTLDRASMAAWIFQQVLDMGYTAERFREYDGHMLHEYGGGRSKPVWAERIGKKYQWIALARLAARLADHATPETRAWDPEPLRTPLTYDRGRDIDPSLLLRTTASSRKQRAWWLPRAYDFDAAKNVPNADWARTYDDLPSNELVVSGPAGPSAGSWFVLEAYPEWSERQPDADSGGPNRNIWLQLRSYLVPVAQAEECWNWLQGKQFFQRWMPEGAEYRSGFIGEYPWATMFNLHREDYGPRGSDVALPCPMVPTCSTVGVSKEYDAYQQDGINFLVPAKSFFDAEALRWNGTSGYVREGDGLRFTDPSVVEPGPHALLASSDFLKGFLKTNQLALVWTVLVEKLVSGNNEAPRFAYSRFHMLTTEDVRSSTPVVTEH